MESFDDNKQRAKVAAGLKGGPFFANPVKVPERQIVNGVPAEVLQEVGADSLAKGNVLDPWVYRTGKGK